MCKRKTITFLLILATTRLYAATLRGVVVENELGGPAMPNVEISAVPPGNPTTTQNNGTFKLEFPGKQPGDIVKLIVSKPGYVVVNDVQLRFPIPSDADTETLTILLCKSEAREEMARRFYRLKSFEAIEETYRRRLEELKASRQADSAALARLAQERDQAKAAADKAAEELAKLTPESTSDLYQEATRLFLAGQMEEALKILDEEKLRRALETAQRLKAKAEKAIEKDIQCYLLKAQLLTTQFRFDEAEKTYEEVLAAAPESFGASFNYAVFNHKLNRHDKALPAYRRCEDLTRRSGDKAALAMTLNNLGILHRDQNRMEEARSMYEEALKTYRLLVEQNPQTYLPDVATTLNNLGNLYSKQNRMEEARLAYEEALTIRRQLAAQNPQTYLPHVATTLNNLGILHSDQHRMEEARMSYMEALKTYRQFAAQNSQTYLPYVATMLNNLGNLYRKQNQMKEAHTAYEEALKTYRQLAAQNPQTYLPDVAMTLNNLGIWHHIHRRLEEARRAYGEALGIYERFAKQNPQQYDPYVTMVKALLKKLADEVEPARY